jgi:poly-gamma-glutamate synthesis protein (capsule biosynthesis protein)
MKKIYTIILLLILILLAGLVFPWRQESQEGGKIENQKESKKVIKKDDKEAKILFVGDMMFDRYIRQVGNNKGEDFVFSCIGDFLRDSDLAVGNLEGPITENASISMFTTPGGEGNYTFTFPTNTAKLLAKNNIRLVSLGNNHIYNFGEAGVASTKRYLTEAGVDYFGLPANRESLVSQIEIKGNKISFINYNEFGNIAVNDVVQKIEEEKQKDRIIIVYTHWGDEYVAPPQRVKNIAKKFADNGADFIIGSHPHVILESENINGAPVYYSLGNFIFDQYFNEEVSTGLVLELNIKNGKIKTFEHKVLISRDGRTCLAD